MNQEEQPLQYIQNVDKKQIEKISQRLVTLGFITENQKNNVLKSRKKKEGNVTIISTTHYKMEFIRHLGKISKKMSSYMRQHRQMYPPIERGNRSNIYTFENYTAFADDIIREYIREKPLTTWGVDFDFKWADFK